MYPQVRVASCWPNTGLPSHSSCRVLIVVRRRRHVTSF
ncbi:hypothetical protein DVS28_b0266 (plasmid) [Euzebya pacifica]|uniref:Uncharacterized protein n=1 Tax=Euzebya pacifica TaxID=1608957 RepID=A0A346Y6D9_9ACTN|nr:hypothetical protein DVS28_b0266 [Euzebya pacifica]